jgi:hypothetical protein
VVLQYCHLSNHSDTNKPITLKETKRVSFHNRLYATLKHQCQVHVQTLNSGNLCVILDPLFWNINDNVLDPLCRCKTSEDKVKNPRIC